MKKNKIFGILVATLGVAFSMTAASALYVRAATNAQIGISAGTYAGSTGNVDYKIANNTGKSGVVAPQYWKNDASTAEDKAGTGLSTEFPQVVYEMSLGAQYANDVPTQTVVTGNLAISLTNVPVEYQSHLSVYAYIDGYASDSIGKTNYERVFLTSDYAITSTNTSYSDNKDIAVKSAGTQKLMIFLKFDSTIADSASLYSKDEGSLGYTLTVTWGQVSNSFESAFVVGDGTQWTSDDEFRMSPDIDNASWRWRFDNCPGDITAAKCVKGSGKTAVWSNGPNSNLDTDKTYDVLWGGSADDVATFTANS